MSKHIKVNLSPSSFRTAAKEVQAYQKNLPAKCRTLVERLTEIGLQEAKARIGQSPLGSTITITTKASPAKVGCKAILVGVGQTQQPADEKFEPINTLIMVEFGAGITYNPVDNPTASEFGFGIGTYPGQTHAFDPEGWMYKDADGKWHHSFGIKATMPMYGATQAMGDQISKIAKEVFGG